MAGITYRLSLVLIISIATATVCLLQPAIGDEALIRTVCRSTPEQDACLACLMTTTGSYQKDKTELAAMSINCASTLSNTVIQDFAGISKGTSDGSVKKLCADSTDIIEKAKITLVDAMLDWSNNQFHSAGDKVANADDLYNSCAGIVGRIPPPRAILEDDLSLLKKYYLNTKAILYKL